MPTAVTADTIVCPYNDVDAAAAAVARYGEGLAAVLVEPVAGNMGVVPPAPGFLEALRTLCDASGALLVFDEVITGFRVARGGAQERFGVAPDLTVLGKIVGGGMPLAAFGGRADVMGELAPSGPVYQAGTLSGNPLATAAGLSVLRRLRDPASTRSSSGAASGSSAGCARRRPARSCSASARWRRSSAGASRSATSRTRPRATRSATARSSATCSARGIYVAPSQFEAMFVSLAHGDDEIDRTVEAVGDFFGRLSSGTSSRTPRPPRAGSGPTRSAPAASATRRPVFSPLGDARARARRRDDLRGLPRPLRPAAPVRAAGRGHGAAARRLPLRPRARADRRAAVGVDAVLDLAQLISLCAQLRGDGRDGDGPAWAATAALLGRGALDEARAALRDDGDPEPLAARRTRRRRGRARRAARLPRTRACVG